MIAVHPGEVLTEYLEHEGWTEYELAHRTGFAPEWLVAVCAGTESVTPELAQALEGALGRPAALWLNLQQHYDAARAGSSALPRVR